jgi:hypothetical protein
MATIKNDAEPGTFKNKVIELMNRKDSEYDEYHPATFFEQIMINQNEGTCSYTTVLKMAEAFSNYFFKHYPTAENFTPEKFAMIFAIFEAWNAEAKVMGVM